ncbi:unnamed protein product [Adineta ricciae]|uniref:Uncharacterized protein n=1 Tax=Adineta ricciae TaxID=249248 RepID=A0A815GW70_ADIRI|nr:unnamed protein product [Adineta ricciae]
MSQSCIIESCCSTLGILCHCCDKTFCPDHLDEHYESINEQLKPLAEEINTLNDQIMNKTKMKLIGNCLDKLNQWRNESYKTINNFYEKKCRELEEYYLKHTENHRKEINEIESELNKLIHEQNTTEDDIKLFQSTIDILQQQIKELHQISYHINIRSFELNQNCLSIEQIKSNEIDFTLLSSPFKTIDCSNYILWKNGYIHHVCWSSTLEKFILIISNKEIFLTDGNFQSIEQINIDPEKKWRLCACSETSLYLLSSQCSTEIFEFDLLSSFQLIQRSKLSHLSQEHDYITDIIYNNETLALAIKSRHKTHIELRSCKTFDRLWLIQLDSKPFSYYSMCLLNCNDWLVLDHKNSLLMHITSNGNIKSTVGYKEPPMAALLLHSNILAIKTENYLNFYKI